MHLLEWQQQESLPLEETGESDEPVDALIETRLEVSSNGENGPGIEGEGSRDGD